MPVVLKMEVVAEGHTHTVTQQGDNLFLMEDLAHQSWSRPILIPMFVEAAWLCPQGVKTHSNTTTKANDVVHAKKLFSCL